MIYLVNRLVNERVQMRLTDGNVYDGKLQRVIGDDESGNGAAVLLMGDNKELIVNLRYVLTVA